ncbi:hypothetical protein QPK87_35940 [Kamptonema cortianum]|uniref:DUF2191 domain-containing protein n=1 Tax=Geitlerinema calcuttense NRMC-F 0142 TaxID=2922238 RepID=A0ABT7M2H8_9CYAN|nr:MULTISPECIES: hypothetical protein [Cyanophyceae]MDK3161904.1 hypothetical protein [Kamptonema cortianum]MDL5050578.1 hypothetical protein [Oscillatoria amoena NRMC-F 0135]MDL5055594.1 hypothetical protein [Oscillatoria laete-virens NRMC-F 0139]MDL5057840.1 hypothetical protein [Geitlerinema calcuttense NRMC-F 0142]
MRTTLDIPDTLYKQAKIRAVEMGTTLKDILLRGLERELSGNGASVAETPHQPYWANRRLLPEYEAALKEGAFSGGEDSTQIISNERDQR